MTDTQKETANESSASPPRILVGFDLYGESDEAITQALAFAVMVPKTQIDIAWIPPIANLPIQPGASTPLPEPKELLRERVQKVVNEFDAERLVRAETNIALVTDEGSPAEALGRIAFMSEADMIIVGAHDSRKGTLETLILGSVAKKLVEEAPCPVLVMRPRLVESLPEVESAPQPGQAKRTIGAPHRYSGATRNQTARENMPLLFPM